jgi:putative intracellular protease/amidase
MPSMIARMVAQFVETSAILCGVATILFPLPDLDFDVTEVAVPWKLLTQAGHKCIFSTERGATPACDPLLITGVLFGKLGARPQAIEYYREMTAAPAFTSPLCWADCHAIDFDALFLAGGHAPGMRQYLGSADVHRLISECFARPKMQVAAICHGVLAAARSVNLAGRHAGKSVLYGLRTTCLPKYMERSAYWSTFWLRGKYYRTYPAYVQDEVGDALEAKVDFQRGPFTLSKRGTADDHSAAFVVEDPGGRYLSARWPGDAYLIANKLIERL